MKSLKNRLVVLSFFCFFLSLTSGASSRILELSSMKELSISDYVTTATNTSASQITRTIQLIIQNKTGETLTNIRAFIRSASDKLSIMDSEVTIKSMGPYATEQSLDSFTVSVPIENQKDSFGFIWHVEFVDEQGNTRQNEIILNETLK